MCRPACLAIAFVLVFTLLSPPPSPATQVQYRSVEQLGSDAQRIVRGTVVDVRPHWNESHTRIFTETSVNIAEDFKGDGSTTVRLLQFGGVVDGVRMTVAGALDWTIGEEVILFIEESLPGRHRVSGFNQGKYSVERDPVTGQSVVRQAGFAPAELVGAPLDEFRTRMPLGELLERALPSDEGGR